MFRFFKKANASENIKEAAEAVEEAVEETAEAAEESIEEAADTAEEAAEAAEEYIEEAAEEYTEEAAEETAETAEYTEEIADTAEEAAEEAAEAAEECIEEAAEAVEEAAEKGAEASEDPDAESGAESEETSEASEGSAEQQSEDGSGSTEKKGFFRRLLDGLSKTRANLARSFSSVFSAGKIDDDFYDELEELLITADMGVETTEKIIDELREKVEENRIKEPAECRSMLIESIKDQMRPADDLYDFENKTSVILVIGVNGTGKTTSIGKLAAMYKKQGRRVLLAAADTFRAAACEQLKEWASRAGVELVSGQEGADPGAVVYDAVAAAKARHADILICDTAGRLHNKKNLMDELGKIYRIIAREYPEAHLETFVVVDGTTGQNALVQAKQFGEAADVTGIILTKLDGTAKGGIAVAIESQLDIPVKFIGVGEKIDDLQRFDPDAFVNAIFEE